jgi:hypothetical protein
MAAAGRHRHHYSRRTFARKTASMPQIMDDARLWRVARALIVTHGAAAVTIAADTASAKEAGGDHEGAEAWKTIGELARKMVGNPAS